MNEKKKYTKKEKELIELIDKVLVGIEEQKKTWSEIFKKYQIGKKELNKLARPNSETDAE